ncbi:response regulator [Sphaerisporangium viridialbum]|uniref:response regulator n=1 Tax=Sphaerisporangium viridialbum TaxID=46189 RepID=UPI003C76F86B
MKSLRIMLVEDQLLMRQGLRKLLEFEPDLQVVGEAADGVEALELVAGCAPQVALVDARMPRMDGVELIRQLARDHPEVACIVLTTFDEDDYLFGALRAGARGYLLKDTSPSVLVETIRKVGLGGTVLEDPAATKVIARLSRVASPSRADFRGEALLSARESEVARLVGIGAANREIAEALFVTEGTVKNHISSVLRKLGLRDRTQLALRVAAGPSEEYGA